MEAIPGLTPAQTRRRTSHFILGQPKDIPNNYLPLEVDIFNYMKKRMDESNSKIQFIAKEVANEVMILWREKGNLPTYALPIITSKVKKLYLRGRNILKIPKDRRDARFFELEGETGKKNRGRPKKNIDTFEKLFDICPCTHMSRELCDCPASEKVPDREFCFLIDQRTERKMYIADIDKNVTKVWMERNERKEKRKL